jgi:hypothetical protein
MWTAQFPDIDNPGQGLVSEMGTANGEVAYSSPSSRFSGVDSQEGCTALWDCTAHRGKGFPQPNPEPGRLGN